MARKRETNQSVTNWSGSVQVTPARLVCPTSEKEISRIVRDAAKRGQRVRPMGSGHSSSQIFTTNDVLISLKDVAGLVDHDAQACEAILRPGTTLHDATAALHAVG